VIDNPLTNSSRFGCSRMIRGLYFLQLQCVCTVRNAVFLRIETYNVVIPYLVLVLDEPSNTGLGLTRSHLRFRTLGLAA
jgi:hypothetical protein